MSASGKINKALIDKLHSAILSDDVTGFYAILEKAPSLYGARFGRFPLESLLVLRSSRRILAAFAPRPAEPLPLPEYPEDYALFKKAAGRALRLYAGGKEVSAEEMRVITGEETALAAGGKLEKAYELSHGKRLKTDKSGSVIAPKSRAVTGDRRKILNIVIAFSALFLIVAAALTALSVTVFGDGSALAPVRAGSATMLLDAALDSDRHIELTDDITLELKEDPALNYTGVLNGNGHTVTLTGGYYGDFLAGASVTNLTVRYDGFRAEYAGKKRTIILEQDFTIDKADLSGVTLTSDLNGNGHTISVTGLSDDDGIFRGALFDETAGNISSLKLDFGQDAFSYTETSGLFTKLNTGSIIDVSFSFSGEVHEINEDEKIYFGLLVGENRGTVSSVTASFEVTGDSTFDGERSEADSFLAGVVGLNSGRLKGLVSGANSSFLTTTLDIAGLVGENLSGGLVADSVNRATLTTASSVFEWNPNAAGIAVVNRGNIENSYNYGALTADSSSEHAQPSGDDEVERGQATVGGIAASNYGVVSKCYNGGNLSSTTRGAIPTIGGSVGTDTAESRNTMITNCISDCTIKAVVEASLPVDHYFSLGGIAGVVSPQGNGGSSSLYSSFSLTVINVPGGINLSGGGIIGAISTQKGNVTLGSVGSADENLYLVDAGADTAVGLIDGQPVRYRGEATESQIRDKESFWYVEEK